MGWLLAIKEFLKFLSTFLSKRQQDTLVQAGKDAKELEIRNEEDRMVDTLNRIDPSKLPDDDAFKASKP